jgi:hypothetical protein
VEDSAQRRWNGAVRCAIRDIAAKPDDITRRGWSSFADTRQFNFSKTLDEDQKLSHFTRQCVGGDGHPVGGNRHLNDPCIYERKFVVQFKWAQNLSI